MKNREKMRQALHAYIDSLDDEGMYRIVIEEDIEGTGIFGCDICEKEYGECANEIECEKKYRDWVKKG